MEMEAQPAWPLVIVGGMCCLGTVASAAVLVTYLVSRARNGRAEDRDHQRTPRMPAGSGVPPRRMGDAPPTVQPVSGQSIQERPRAGPGVAATGAGPTIMDCLVNYFSDEQADEGMPRRYFCYQIVAGPGPTPDSGVATVATLAVLDPNAGRGSCQVFHAVKSGGPAAAIASALAYLDAFHEADCLRKVQTELRRVACT